MSRTAKTNHVMNLVGRDRRENQAVSEKKAAPSANPTVSDAPAVINPVLNTLTADNVRQVDPENKPEKPDIPEQSKDETEDKSPSRPSITAIVPDLINQELETVVNRFNIDPTDSNLWQLTRAALEAVKPEFSLNDNEYEEKCGRLRQRVIMEMTKAAIKLNKHGREA